MLHSWLLVICNMFQVRFGLPGTQRIAYSSATGEAQHWSVGLTPVPPVFIGIYFFFVLLVC